MPEDMMTQFMQMMRMMEFMRQRKRERTEEENPLGSLALKPGLRERYESLPEDQRGEFLRQFHEAHNVPQGKRAGVEAFMRSPSQRYQFETEKFMAHAEEFKGELDSMRRAPARMRAWMSMYEPDKAKVDKFMIPFEEETHARAQTMIRTISRMGQAAFRAHPDDPKLKQILKDLEATSALGQGAGESFRPGGTSRPQAAPAGRQSALEQMIGMGAPQRPGSGVLLQDEE